MGESRCFLCRQGFGRRGQWKVRVFLCDEAFRDTVVCRICLRGLRDQGEIQVARGGSVYLVRELLPPLPDVSVV